MTASPKNEPNYLFFAWGCDLNQDFPIVIWGKKNRLYNIIL